MVENPEPYFGAIISKCQKLTAGFYVVISHSWFYLYLPHNLYCSPDIWSSISLKIIEYNRKPQKTFQEHGDKTCKYCVSQLVRFISINLRSSLGARIQLRVKQEDKIDSGYTNT